MGRNLVHLTDCQGLEEWRGKLAGLQLALDAVSLLKEAARLRGPAFGSGEVYQGIAKTLDYVRHGDVEHFADGVDSRLNIRAKEDYAARSLSGHVLQRLKEGETFIGSVNSVSIHESMDGKKKRVFLLIEHDGRKGLVPFEKIEIVSIHPE